MENKNKLFSDAVLYTVGRILPQVISFALLPVFTYCLTVSEFGIVNSMQSMGPIIIILFTFALDRGVLRMYYDIDSELERKSYLFSVSFAIFVISTLSLIVMIIFNDYINLAFPSIGFYPFFIYSILTVYFNSFSLVPLLYFQIQKKPITYNILTFGNYILGISLCYIFVVIMDQGAAGMLKGTLISCAVFFPIYLTIIIKVSLIRINVSKLKDTLIFALPMIPHLLCAWVINFSDRIFIENYHDQFDVGIYSLAAKINSAILIVLLGFTAAYSPHFYEIASKVDEEKLHKLSFYNNLICKFFILVIFSVVLISDDIIKNYNITDKVADDELTDL